MAENSSNDIVTKDMTLEILSRLPVKTLLRFQSVSKHWRDLVKTYRFITKHLHRHSNHARLLIRYHNSTTDKTAFALFPDEMLASTPLVYHDIDHISDPNKPEHPSVAGPFDGMLLIWNWGHMALWNPATKEYKPLPIPPPHLPPHFNHYCNFYGLGLVPTTKDYKLVWIRYFWDSKEDNPYLPSVVAVYTLSTNSWRVYDVDLPSNRSIHNSLCNTYTRGHYWWRTNNDDHEYKVLSFNMDTEAFRELPAPPDISKKQWGDLALYNDLIAMFLYEANAVEKYFDIWVMDEEECWSKHFIIGPLANIDAPLGFWKNGEIFLETSAEELVLYNPETQEMKELGPRGKDNCLQVYLYKESLLSVSGGDDCRENNSSCDTV